MGKQDEYVSDDDNSEDEEEEEEECPECGIVFTDLSELASHYFNFHKEKKPAPASSTSVASSGAPPIISSTPASIPVRKYQVQSIHNRAGQQNPVNKEEKLKIPSDQSLTSSAPKNKPYSYVAQRISSSPLPNKPSEISSNASVQMGKPSMSAQIAKPTMSAQAAKPLMSAQTAKPSMAAQVVKPTMSALAAKPPAASQSAKPLTSVQTAKPPMSAQTAKNPSSTQTVKPPASIQTAKPPASVQTSKPPASGQIAKPPASAQTAKPPASTQTAKPPASAQTAKPLASAQTAKPLASAQTAKPPASAQTAKPPASSQMAKPPSTIMSSKIPSLPTFLQSPKPSPVQSSQPQSMQPAKQSSKPSLKPTVHSSNPSPILTKQSTNQSPIPVKRSNNRLPDQSSSPSTVPDKQPKLPSVKSQPTPRRSARKQSTEPPTLSTSKTSPNQNRGMEMIIKNMFGPQISKDNDDIVIIEKNEANDGVKLATSKATDSKGVNEVQKIAKNEIPLQEKIVEKDLKDTFDDPEDTSVTPSEDLGTYENMLARYIQENDLPFIPRFRNRSDGNCWYEAIADQIDLHDIPNVPRDHVGLRKAICDALLNLPQSNSWIKNLFGGKKKRFLNFVEKHRKDGEWTDSKGLVCQATALMLQRKIHIVGTANMNQSVCYTKLESVPEADQWKPLIVGYYQDKHYQSLESIDFDFVSESVPQNKNVNSDKNDTQNTNENALCIEELDAQVKVDELKQNDIDSNTDTQNTNENASNLEELEAEIKVDELKENENIIKCVPKESVNNVNSDQNVKVNETSKLEGSTKSAKPQGKIARDPIRSKPLRKKSTSSGKMVRTPIVSQVPRKINANPKEHTEDNNKKNSLNLLANKNEDKVKEREFNNEGEVEKVISFQPKIDVPVLEVASAASASEETSSISGEKIPSLNKAVKIPDDARELIEAIRVSVNNVNNTKRNSQGQTLIENENNIFKAKSTEVMKIEKSKMLEDPNYEAVEEKVNVVIEADTSKLSQKKSRKSINTEKTKPVESRSSQRLNSLRKGLESQNDQLKKDENLIGPTKLETPNFKITRKSDSTRKKVIPENKENSDESLIGPTKLETSNFKITRKSDSTQKKVITENKENADESLIGPTKLETPNFKITRKSDSTQKKVITENKENGDENLIGPTKLETPNFKITRKSDSTRKKVITENRENISVVVDNTNNNLSPVKKDDTQTLKNVKVSKVKSAKKPQLSIAARRKQLNGAATKIQTWYKHAHQGLVERRNFLRTKDAAIKIQAYWRSFRTKNLVAKNRAAVILQSQWRSFEVRRQFLKKRKAASLVQKRYRTTKSGKVDRKAFLRKKKAAIAIQTRWRRWLGLVNGPMFQLLPPDEHYINPETGELQLMDDYVINPQTGEMEKSPVDLPQYLNRISGFLDFTKLSKMAVKSWKKSKLKLEMLEKFQSQLPQYKITKRYKRYPKDDVKESNEVELTAQKIISVNLKPPKTLDSKGDGGKWDKIEQKKETFGGILCETSLWKKSFNTIGENEVQSDSDNNNDDSFEDCNYEEPSFKRLLEGLHNSSKDFSSLVSNDKIPLSKQQDYLRFGNLRSSGLESENTSWLESRIEMRRQSLRNKSAIIIQSCWRGHIARKNWINSRNSAVKIQKWIRNIKEKNSTKEMARAEMETYTRKKSSARILQSRWRVWIAAKKTRRRFLSLKNAAITMQSHWRGLVGRRRSAAVKAKRDAPKLLLFSTFHEDSSSDEEASGSVPSTNLKRKAKTSPETQPKKKIKGSPLRQEKETIDDDVDDEETNLRRSSRTRTLTKS